MLNKSLWEKKIFWDSFLLKKIINRKLKLWLYNQYKKEETDSEEEEIIIKENLSYELLCDILNNTEKYVKVKNGNFENKFLIYNEEAKDGEPFIIAVFRDIYAFCVFFYISKKEGKYIVKNKWFDEIEIEDMEKFLNNLQECNVNLDVPEFINLKRYYYNELTLIEKILKRYFETGKIEAKLDENIKINRKYSGIKLGDHIEKVIPASEKRNLKKYYQYLLYEDKEQKYSLFANPKTGKIVKIDIKDEKYFPAEDLKIGDYLTKEKMEKYEIYYDEDDEDVWLSEVVKELAIVTELVWEYPNQKEKILWYVWFDYKEYGF